MDAVWETNCRNNGKLCFFGKRGSLCLHHLLLSASPSVYFTIIGYLSNKLPMGVVAMLSLDRILSDKMYQYHRCMSYFEIKIHGSVSVCLSVQPDLP